MTVEASLRAITQRVIALLECSDVLLSLSSPLAQHDSLEDDVASLLTYKEVQALVACAVQEQSIQSCNDCSLQFQQTTLKSIAVLPLERPTGLLGFLICIDTQHNKFLHGEHSLLEQVLPGIAREVEQFLSNTDPTPVLHEEQEPQTRHALQEQQTLVSLVGHDLRMPLTAIKGYAGLLQAYGSTPSTTEAQVDLTPELQQQYLAVIMEQTEHMEVLVNDLLDVSRIRSGQLALRCTWADIITLCRRVVRVVQDKCEQQSPGKYTLRCRFEAESALVWADPDRVWQVLTNLVENAVKYSPDGGVIEVHVRNSAMASSVTIRDWGLGISEQQQDSLFHVFSRGEQYKQHEIAGLGLGLYIARTLVEAMDGRIMLRSSQGAGTSISFTLPRGRISHSTDLQSSKNISTEIFYSCERLSGLL